MATCRWTPGPAETHRGCYPAWLTTWAPEDTNAAESRMHRAPPEAAATLNLSGLVATDGGVLGPAAPRTALGAWIIFRGDLPELGWACPEETPREG